MTPFRQEIDRLRKDYPAFVIVPTRVYNGERVAAYRQDRAAHNGLYALIGTPDEVEAELAKAVAELRASLGC
jgi:alkanesulfonate monooxygenase SsuD/methylene tetrahydromethanopterin reductase-like flavin-dependent oxidoreductase (luciferase family)